jgi:hypothetical protein
MKGRQFEQFAIEVLHRGAVAVLPQNLPDRWLNALMEEAEILYEGKSHEIENTCAGLLGAVILLLSAQSGHPPTLYGLLHHHALCRDGQSKNGYLGGTPNAREHFSTRS